MLDCWKVLEVNSAVFGELCVELKCCVIWFSDDVVLDVDGRVGLVDLLYCLRNREFTNPTACTVVDDGDRDERL